MPEQPDIPISSFPDAESITNADKVTGLQDGANKNFTFSSILAWFVNAVRSAFVPIGRTINGKSLSSDITLTASDVGARPNTWTPSAADVGLGNVANERQYSALNPPPLPTPSDIGAQDTITASGILKGDGAGGVTAAVAGTDYGTYSKPSGGIPASDLASGVIPTVPSAYTSNPAMDGTASPGTSNDYARGDHVHPTDSTKAAKSDLTSIQATGTTNTTGAAIPAGAYFYLNGVLHRAKTQIAVNATFTVNTNCEQVTEGGFNAILPAITNGTVTTTKASGFVQTFSVAGLYFTYFKITTSVVTSTSDVLATVPAAYSPLLREIPVEFLFQRPTDSAPIIRGDRAGIWLDANGEITQRLSNSWPANTLMQGLFIYTR